MMYLLYVCSKHVVGGLMAEKAVAELKKELTDLKIRVNNLEKKMSPLSKKPKPKRQSFI